MMDVTDVISWSHSSMATYKTCPRQYKGKYLTKKFPFEQNAQAKWGDDVHNALEASGKTGAPMPSNMTQYAPYLNALMRRPGVKEFEGKFAVRIDREPCGYFAKVDGKSVVWVRAKIDVINFRADLRRAEIFDWKTGKKKNDPAQLVLYALLVFLHYPDIDEIRAGYCWLGEGLTEAFTAPVTFKRAQLDDLWNHYMNEYRHLKHAVETDYFPERPSGLCAGWCPDEDCPHWTPKRAK